MFFTIKGTCESVNIIDIGNTPNTLKFTQKSVEKFRQIASFKIARKTKKRPQRKDKTIQILSSIFKLSPNKCLINGRLLK